MVQFVFNELSNVRAANRLIRPSADPIAPTQFRNFRFCIGPYLFPPRVAGEDEGEGLNGLNDWNVLNGSVVTIMTGSPPYNVLRN